jgi:hypothetical protein
MPLDVPPQLPSPLYACDCRCVTIHATDNALVESTVCVDHIGHGFFIEDGCEVGNTLQYVGIVL